MRRYLTLVFLLAGFVLSVSAKGQSVELVPVAGKVFWRRSSQKSWQAVESRKSIDINSEVSTAGKSRCLIIFNKDKTNVVEVSPNSKIKVASLYKIYLYQGEALAWVRGLKKNETFEVQTPTAISGARGTAWFSRFTGGSNRVGCLRHRIFVRGLDANGNPTGEEELGEGFGLDVGVGGVFGGRYELPPDERERLGGMENDLGAFSGSGTPSGGESLGGDMPSAPGGSSDMQDMRDEASESWREGKSEAEREMHEHESSGSDEPGGGGNGDSLVVK